ncbi:unnamed protein product, partial [Oppiella nova]
MSFMILFFEDEVVFLEVICIVFLTVIFVRIFDLISDRYKVDINLLAIMGNIISRITGSNDNNRGDNITRSSFRHKSKPDNNGSPQVNAPEIRKHSSTPVSETTPKYERKLAKPLHSTANSGKHVVPKARDKDKDKTVYTTTFETQVDAPPPHPLEERFQDIQLDEIEVETNLFAPEVEDAVIKIQAGVRGYLVRKQVKELKNNAVNDDEEDTPVVPPPKHFDDFGSDDNQGLSPLCDLEKWKKLSQHLEEIVKDNAEDVNGSAVKTSDDKSPQVPITENVIPLKDSNDHKVIETFDCKENILDIESPEVLSSIKTSTDEKVVEKDMKTLEQINNKTNRLNSTVSESQESEVLAELNQILDNDEKNMKNNELNA